MCTAKRFFLIAFFAHLLLASAAPMSAQEDFYRSFDPQETDFKSVVEAFNQLSRTPEERKFNIRTITVPQLIPFEKLTAEQAKEGLYWYGPGEYSVTVSQESRDHFRDVIVPALDRFFSKIALDKKEVTIDTQSYIPMKRNGYGDFSFGEVSKAFTKGTSHLIIAHEPDLAPLFNATEERVPVSIDCTVYNIPEAYGNDLPKYEPAKKSSTILYSFLVSEDGVFLHPIEPCFIGNENACRTRIDSYGNFLTTFAGWPMGVTGGSEVCYERIARSEPFAVSEEVAQKGKKIKVMLERPKSLIVPDQVATLPLACEIIETGVVITIKPGTYQVDHTIRLCREFTIAGSTGNPEEVVIQSDVGTIFDLSLWPKNREKGGSVTIKDLTLKVAAQKKWPITDQQLALKKRLIELQSHQKPWESESDECRAARKALRVFEDENRRSIYQEEDEIKDLPILFVQAGDQRIVNCRFESDCGPAIVFHGSELTTTMENCAILGCRYCGVNIEAYAAPTLTDCRIEQVNGIGIFVADGSPSTIKGVAIRDVGIGVWLENGSKATLSDFTIQKADTGIISEDRSQCVVQNGLITKTKKEGIRIEGGSKTVFTDNRFYKNNWGDVYDESDPPEADPSEAEKTKPAKNSDVSSYSAFEENDGDLFGPEKSDANPKSDEPADSQKCDGFFDEESPGTDKSAEKNALDDGDYDKGSGFFSLRNVFLMFLIALIADIVLRIRSNQNRSEE